MVSLKELVMKCKQQCDKLISIFDDSHNYETAVETFMRENTEESTNIVSNDVEVIDCQQANLYVEPINDADKVVQCDRPYNETISNKEGFTPCDEGINRVDELIDSCVDIPSYIDLDKSHDKSGNENLVTNVSLDNNETKEIRMMMSVTLLVEELDHIVVQSIEPNVQSSIKYCQDRLFEILFDNGCDKIDSDTTYDSERHTVRPFSIISKGTHICGYRRDGVLFNGKVLLKALVKIELLQ